jgi:WD40 repeat protein
MADIFISYSRADKEFARRLHDALAARGRDVWVDWEDIPLTADWWKEIQENIEAANAFLFVISPHSAASKVCGQEVAHAVSENKRLLPILYSQVDPNEVPEALRALNWVPFTEDEEFDTAFEALLRAMDTDLEWVQSHTRLLVRAEEWKRNGSDPSFALQGSDLVSAERWLARAGQGKDPRPTELQTQYILASRGAATGRHRKALVALSVGLVVSLLLALVAWVNMRRANHFLALSEAARFNVLAVRALAEDNAPAAEILYAKTLTMDDRPEIRERLLEARARAVRPVWVTPAHEPGGVLAVSPDGRHALEQAPDGKLRLWDLEARKVASTIPSSGERASCAAFGPGGLLAWGNSSGEAHLLDENGTGPPKVLRAGRSEVRSLAFSPHGRRLAAGLKDASIRVWDLRAGFLSRVLEGHKDQVQTLAFSPDGGMLASGSWDGRVQLWSMTSGKIAHTLRGHDDAVLCVAFSPDGRLVASGSWDNRVWIWDARTGRKLRPLAAHTAGVLCLAFSGDGRLLASGSEDRTVRIWDMDVGRAILTLRGHEGHVTGVGFRQDRPVLASGGEEGAVRLWDLEKPARRSESLTLRGHLGPVATVDFSPEGSVLASGSWDQTVRLWDPGTGRALASLAGHTDQILCLAFSPDGRLLASGGKDFTLRLWDVAARKVLRILPHGSQVRSVAFSPDGRRLATGADDRKIRIWDVETGKRVAVLSGHGDKVLCVAFSRDGKRLASGGEDKTVRLWDTKDWKEAGAALQGLGGSVWGIAFTPEGDRLVLGSEDGTVRFWDLQGKRTRTLAEYHVPVWDIALSRDGRTVASAGQDATVRLQDLRTGESHTLRAFEGPVWWVAFSRDGQRLVAGGEDRTVRVWDLGYIHEVLTRSPASLLHDTERETGLRVAGSEVVPAR